MSKSNVHYLAFEGGGGKGVVFLGALQALEAEDLLPIDLSVSMLHPDRSPIAGVSGASAGAITALLVAMGKHSSEIGKLIANDPRKGLRSPFEDFFDEPRPGKVRGVGPSGAYERGQLPREGEDSARRRAVAVTEGLTPENDFSRAVLKVLARQTAPGRRFLTAPVSYVYNLLYDRGIFPGFAVRTFFERLIREWWRETYDERARAGLAPLAGCPDANTGHRASFKCFCALAQVDLAVTAVNLTTHRPQLFSPYTTPNFPVAEAVAISMNLPLVFKPVWVNKELRTTANVSLEGHWADGGLLNNLPIHAFDDAVARSRQPQYSLPLNPHMLGMRLSPSSRNDRRGIGDDTFAAWLLGGMTIGQVVGDFWETLLYPSEEGQIRTAEEAHQTVELHTGDLSLLDFGVPVHQEPYGALIKAAKTQTREALSRFPA